MTQDWNLASEYFTVLSNSIHHHHRARFRTKEYSGHLPRSGGVTLAWRSSEKHLVPAMRRTRTWSPGRYVTTLALLQSTWWTEKICKYCSELPSITSKAIGSLIYSIQGGTVAFSEPLVTISGIFHVLQVIAGFLQVIRFCPTSPKRTHGQTALNYPEWPDCTCLKISFQNGTHSEADG